MKRIKVKVNGTSPLLMNRMPIEALEGLRDKTKKRKFSTRPKDPRQEAEPKIYKTEQDKPYIPTENLMSALISAGVYIRLDGKRQLSTQKSTLVPGFLDIETPYLLLTNGSKKSTPKWEVDMRQGRNPNGGEAVCIVRPRFDLWGFEFSMLADDESIPIDRIRELVDIALHRVGLCDFRPARKGIYGKSKIVSWVVKGV